MRGCECCLGGKGWGETKANENHTTGPLQIRAIELQFPTAIISLVHRLHSFVRSSPHVVCDADNAA